MRWLEPGATPTPRVRLLIPMAGSHHSPRSSCCARGRSSAHMRHFVRDDVTFGRRGALRSRDAPILHRLLLHLLQHLNSPRP